MSRSFVYKTLIILTIIAYFIYPQFTNYFDSIHSPNYSNKTLKSLNLKGFDTLEEAMAYGEKVKKPLFIFFDAICVSSKKYRATFIKHKNQIEANYVFVHLYTDDRTPLPNEDRTTKVLNDRTYEINTVGKKNAYLQQKKYNSNITHLMVLSTEDTANLLSIECLEYDTNLDSLLRNGVSKFKQLKIR